MPLSERKIAVATLVVAMVSILVSVVLTFAALSHAERLATASGALTKPEILAAIGQVALEPDKTHRIVFGAKAEELAEGLVIAPFTVGIKNTGDASLEDIYVSFRYDRRLKRRVLELLDFETVGMYSVDTVKRSFSESGGFDIVSYYIESLNPSVGLGIDEPFVLRETKTSTTVDVDGYQMPFVILYSITFQLSINAKTEPNQDYELSVTVFSSEDIDELFEKVKEEMIFKEIEDLRSNSSFFEYLGFLIFENPEREVVLLYPANKRYQKDDAVVFSPDPEQIKLRTLLYRAASWGRLF